MTEQLDVFGGAKPIGRTAPRQDAVLEFLREHPEGITVDEAGQAVHAAAGKHDADTLCRWCSSDGKGILRALERKQLVKRTGKGQWALKTEASHDASFGDIPF